MIEVDKQRQSALFFFFLVRKITITKLGIFLDFPGGPVVKNLPVNAEDKGWIPGLGRFHVQWGN